VSDARGGRSEPRRDERFEGAGDVEDAPLAELPEEEARTPGSFGLHVPAPTGEMALRATNLGIRYNLNLTKKTKLRTTFANLLDPRRRHKGHFWALRGVDLTVSRGEAVGVIGPNGSGKSTLLLALAGIIQPSEGVVEANGHVSTLLSLQAGFDADLSGRENIALAGALMGIDHRIMDEITPGIISFANIGAFIDAPMKTYSSGMRARVGFSIATAVDPDILLLDEVLQTGDNQFKQKSRRRIAEVLQTAKAVVMVTHDMSWITAFCTRAVLLDKGKIVAEGDPDEIADLHEEDAERRKRQKRKAKQLIKHGKVDIVDIRRARKEGKLADVAEGEEELDEAELDDEDIAELEELKASVAARKANR
jgi:ABC-type polysaccharide/polyol phosphate transport system ATPase subunit